MVDGQVWSVALGQGADVDKVLLACLLADSIVAVSKGGLCDFVAPHGEGVGCAFTVVYMHRGS